MTTDVAPSRAASPGPETARSSRLRRLASSNLFLAATLFLLTFVAYRAAPVYQMSDSRYLAVVSESLIERGTLALPEQLASVRHNALRRSGSGVRFHFFPHAPAVLNVPFVFGYRLAGVSLFDEEGDFLQENEVRILRTSAAAVTALTVALSFLLGRVYLSRGWSVTLAVVFAFGTQLFSSASRAYWSHAWAVCLLTLALYLLLSAGSRFRRAHTVAAATALAWAYFCRPTTALSAVALTLFVAWKRPRLLVWFVATGALWAAVFVAHSLYLHDQVLPPYFYSDQRASGRLSVAGLLEFGSNGAIGTLFSPGRGLLVFTPIFALIPLYVAIGWRRLPSRVLSGLGIAVMVVHWKLISSFRNWWGGASYGPRLFTDLIPWFFLLAVLALAAALAAKRSKRSAVAQALLCSLLVLFSVFVHTRGAVQWETFRWGGVRDLEWAQPGMKQQLFEQERLWRWRYPQFLAGLVPIPPPKSTRGPLCSGLERSIEARCVHKLKVRLRGEPRSGYRIKVIAERVRRGKLGKGGRALEVFDRPVEKRGPVTVAWDCGTVNTERYVCSGGAVPGLQDAR